MMLLGSERIVTQNYDRHKYAEDYAGIHLSDIKINGQAKVLKVVNKYEPYQDTINYNDYLNNKNSWKDGLYYNCLSISGKRVRYHQAELGGNQVTLETYNGSKKLFFNILHMASVLVNEGDLIDSNTIIGKQGNTGLVLSNKDKTDYTYGSHVHFEIRDEDYNPINPRDYALFNIKVNYIEQSNQIDNSQKQIKVLADKINIRAAGSVNSQDIGDVFRGEIYTVLGEEEDNQYYWYKIKTNLGLKGFVANEKGKRWLLVFEPNLCIEGECEIVDDISEEGLVFICPKDDLYAIRLKKDEKLYIK